MKIIEISDGILARVSIREGTAFLEYFERKFSGPLNSELAEAIRDTFNEAAINTIKKTEESKNDRSRRQ